MGGVGVSFPPFLFMSSYVSLGLQDQRPSEEVHAF